MAALLCTEAIAEGLDKRQPVYVAALDSRKAFDVVNHTLLKKKLYSVNQDPRLWRLEEQMLDGLSAKVRVGTALSEPFNIKQGVGQGKVLSPMHFKTYIDETVAELTSSGQGATIGDIPVGVPTCADDILAITNSLDAMQSQLDVAESAADHDRSTLHALKFQVIAFNHPDGEDPPSWELGGHTVKAGPTLTHLGLLRKAQSLSPDEAIDAHVNTARGALYSMLGAGLHGRNGLTPLLTRSLYVTYVIPRLMYGLEALILQKSQIKTLEMFQYQTLKMLQSLPGRAANCSSYLLLGVPPVEALLDINIANLVGRIARQEGSTLRNLMERQLATKGTRSHSWFVYVSKRLERYNLPDLHTLLAHPPTPVSWKLTVKSAILDHWLDILCKDAASKPSMRYLCLDNCSLTQPHPVWRYATDTARQRPRICVRAKLLTGTYTLQANRHKFNQYEVSATCQLCKAAPENRSHFIRQCTKFTEIRAKADSLIAEIIPDFHLLSEEEKLQHILDTDVVVADRANLERICARFLYSLHCMRTFALDTG